MSLTTISSQDFNQDIECAKRAADAGPVVIPPTSLLDVLAMPESDAIDFDPPRMTGGFVRAADLG